MSDKKSKKEIPITFSIANWYGFIFAVIYLLYGGVKLILSFLDRTYDDMMQFIIFFIIGILLVFIAFAFKEHKSWGWYGLLVINSIIFILTLWHIFTGSTGTELLYENLVILLFSIVGLYSLLSPQTRRYLSI